MESVSQILKRAGQSRPKIANRLAFSDARPDGQRIDRGPRIVEGSAVIRRVGRSLIQKRVIHVDNDPVASQILSSEWR